jgi:signal transduction histidine kinase
MDISEFEKNENELLRLNKELRALSQYTQTTTEDEKLKIRNEIHDELGQYLVGLIFAIKRTKALVDYKPKLEQALDEMEEEVFSMLKSFKRIYASMHPTMLKEMGLNQSLEFLLESVFNERPVEVIFNSVFEDNELDYGKKLGLYRIAQQALNNIVIHSRANVVKVEIKRNDFGFICLNIEDNGVGFEILDVDTMSRHGILEMRERAYGIDAEFYINSKMGKGTKISVIV